MKEILFNRYAHSAGPGSAISGLRSLVSSLVESYFWGAALESLHDPTWGPGSHFGGSQDPTWESRGPLGRLPGPTCALQGARKEGPRLHLVPPRTPRWPPGATWGPSGPTWKTPGRPSERPEAAKVAPDASMEPQKASFLLMLAQIWVKN